MQAVALWQDARSADRWPFEGDVVEISAILSNIKYKQYSLPQFQRGYVWRREDVRGRSD